MSGTPHSVSASLCQHQGGNDPCYQVLQAGITGYTNLVAIQAAQVDDNGCCVDLKACDHDKTEN